jgi:hypothetical protein
MKGVQASKSLAEDIRRALSEYSELDEELKGLPDIHYCAGLSFTSVSDWNRAIDEFARAIELSKNGDHDAKRALISILELILY